MVIDLMVKLVISQNDFKFCLFIAPERLWKNSNNRQIEKKKQTWHTIEQRRLVLDTFVLFLCVNESSA